MIFYYDFRYKKENYMIEFNKIEFIIYYKLFFVSYGGEHLQYENHKYLAGMPLTINPIIKECKHF